MRPCGRRCPRWAESFCDCSERTVGLAWTFRPLLLLLALGLVLSEDSGGTAQ